MGASHTLNSHYVATTHGRPGGGGGAPRRRAAAVGRAAHRRRDQRAGRPVRGRGRPDPERGAPGADRADAGAGRAAAAVKARRTPQEFPMVTEVPKSPTPTRPTSGGLLKFLTFGEHICFYRYLVGAGDLDSRVQPQTRRRRLAVYLLGARARGMGASSRSADEPRPCLAC